MRAIRLTTEKKLLFSLMISILHAMSLTVYFVEPILIWVKVDKISHVSAGFNESIYIFMYVVACFLFYVPLYFNRGDNFVDLIYRISVKTIGTAVPGFIVLMFVVVQTLTHQGFNMGAFGKFIVVFTIFSSFFLPLYVIFVIPVEIWLYQRILTTDSAMNHCNPILIAILLIALPFLGVTATKVIYVLLKLQH